MLHVEQFIEVMDVLVMMRNWKRKKTLKKDEEVFMLKIMYKMM